MNQHHVLVWDEIGIHSVLNSESHPVIWGFADCGFPETSWSLLSEKRCIVICKKKLEEV